MYFENSYKQQFIRKRATNLHCHNSSEQSYIQSKEEEQQQKQQRQTDEGMNEEAPPPFSQGM